MKRLEILPLITLCLIWMLTGCMNSEFTHGVTTKAKPWTQLNFHNNPDNFQFAIVSDRSGGCRKNVFRNAVEALNLLKPEFVMSVGDLIHGYKKDSAKLSAEWGEINNIIGKLQMPFFYVPGNHDISNKAMAALWKKQFGVPYYSFVYKNVLFLCLNTEESNVNEGLLGNKQLAWIKRVLKDHRHVRWTCVFMHQPLWYNDRDKSFKKLEKMLQSRKYTVFAGHFHQYRKCTRNGRKYYIFATTGGVSKLRGPLYGEFDEVVWVTMTGKGPAIANLMIDGILPEDITTAFQKNISFELDEKKSSKDKICFSLPLKNTFNHKLKYDISWSGISDAWKTKPEKSAGFIKPGGKKVLHFVSTTKRGSNAAPTCTAKFQAKNELDINFKLDTKRLVAEVKQPSVKAAFTKESPVIDGKLDDPVWKKADKADCFFTVRGDPVSAKTVARCAYDKDNLYLSFMCMEPNMKKLKSLVKKHDGPVWTDDSIEIFLDTNKDEKTYYQIAVNPSAVIYDSSVKNKASNTGYDINPRVRACLNNNFWTLEMAVPWRNLKVGKMPINAQTMRLLLVRTRTRTKEKMQYPTVFGDNHQPEKFGTLKFIK